MRTITWPRASRKAAFKPVETIRPGLFSSLTLGFSADKVGHFADRVEIFDDYFRHFDLELKLRFDKGDQLHGTHRINHALSEKGRVISQGGALGVVEIFDNEFSNFVFDVHNVFS